LNAVVLRPVNVPDAGNPVAAWIPARRALAVDPLILLRED
jgi:hypothetical protein